MNELLKRSRIAKALTDRTGNELEFDMATARLDAVLVTVVLADEHKHTAAAQAAAITAVAIAQKCFGAATLVINGDVTLVKPIPIGDSVIAAARALGATVTDTVPNSATHVVFVGDSGNQDAPPFVRCWWNEWIAGVVPPWDTRTLGASGNPLAGIFAGAVAVREVFATVLGYPRCGSRVSIASLWEPWANPETATAGPSTVYFPNRLWFIGLGHLGQGYLWSMGFLRPALAEVVLQDDQAANDENVGTGLLTTCKDIGKKKARIAARWVDGLARRTSIIERRQHGDIGLREEDPAIALVGVDSLEARLTIAGVGFDHIIDVGLGHGPVDFEGLQMRVLDKGADSKKVWQASEGKKDVDALLRSKAYAAHAEKFDGCGTLALANGSVAVPFVGTAAGALGMAQAIRIASMRDTPQLLQMELGSPEMVIACTMNEAPAASVGSTRISFEQP